MVLMTMVSSAGSLLGLFLRIAQIRKTATEKAGDMTEASLTYLKQEFSRLKVEYNALQTKHRFMQRLQDIGDGNNKYSRKYADWKCFVFFWNIYI